MALSKKLSHRDREIGELSFSLQQDGQDHGKIGRATASFNLAF
jgi:hypothetical protein